MGQVGEVGQQGQVGQVGRVGQGGQVGPVGQVGRGARGKRPRTLNPPPKADTLEGLSVVQLIPRSVGHQKKRGYGVGHAANCYFHGVSKNGTRRTRDPCPGKGILNNPLLKRSYVGFWVEGLQVYSFPNLN